MKNPSRCCFPISQVLRCSQALSSNIRHTYEMNEMERKRGQQAKTESAYHENKIKIITWTVLFFYGKHFKLWLSPLLLIELTFRWSASSSSFSIFFPAALEVAQPIFNLLTKTEFRFFSIPSFNRRNFFFLFLTPVFQDEWLFAVARQRMLTIYNPHRQNIYNNL